jgi:hypothetical protein
LTYLDDGNAGCSYQAPIEELFKEGAKILEGNNRHLGLLRAMESLIKRNKGILSLEEIRQNARQVPEYF